MNKIKKQQSERLPSLLTKLYFPKFCSLTNDCPLFSWHQRRKRKAWQKRDAAREISPLRRRQGLCAQIKTRTPRLARSGSQQVDFDYNSLHAVYAFLKKAGENFHAVSPWGLSVVWKNFDLSFTLPFCAAACGSTPLSVVFFCFIL